MIVGMDFGTTNSGMAVYNGRSVNILPLDPANANPRVVRTALYIMNDQTLFIGRDAVDRYFAQNVGRPVKMQRVWIGELEIFGADMYYVTDAYAWVDILSPGRLFLSVKTSLRDALYAGTVVGQFYYSLENLVALYLTVTRLRAEKLLNQPVRQVVLGRPVRFSQDPEKDALAQSRLLQAAFRAGYEKVYLQPEPIAAAFSYETSIDQPQNVLVFDFGGGTLDITVMRLGDPGQRRVLATGGIPVAGDVFDQKLVRAKLPRHFGEGSRYGPRHKALTLPKWIFDTFSDWQTILELQSADNRKILGEIAQTAQRRYQIEALISLVSSNYGLKMFDIVEQAKRKLSDKRGAEILLDGPGFHVRDFVTRTEFEQIIRTEIRAIEDHLAEVVTASGLAPDEIDAVIRTGGSAQIPAFLAILEEMFGADKIRSVDTFSSVTAGLGVIGHGVAQGELEIPAFTPEMVQPPQPAVPARPNVSPVNLELLQRRITLEETADSPLHADQQSYVVLGPNREVAAIPVTDHPPDIHAPLNGPPRQISTAPDADRLLLITTQYRFLLVTPRQLHDLYSIDLTLDNLHHFQAHETICTVTHWPSLKAADKLLLITSAGYARWYPIDVLQTSIEAPVPLLFDQPLPGVVVAALAASGDEQLTLVTANGRLLRWPVNRLRVSGLQLFKLSGRDRVNVAVLTQENDDLLLLTADGYGRRHANSAIPIPAKANDRGITGVARRSPVTVLTPLGDAPTTPVVTSQRVVALENGRLPREASTKTYPALDLQPDETICTVWTNGRRASD